MNLGKELKTAKELAVRAGIEIMKIYESDFEISEKVDDNSHKSPLTEADLRANEIIVNGLRSSFPKYSILTEEERDSRERLSNDIVWIIDPLDGTKEFIKRNGEFTVNIGLVNKGRPVLGVIYVPVTEEMYFASQGMGAFMVKDGKTERIAVSHKDSTEKMVLVKSRSHANERLQGIIDRLKFAEVKTSGSSVKGCLVARGYADVYIRLGPQSEWDICAMNAIIDEAGGKMTGLDGKTLKYNKENILIETGFLVSNNRIHEKLLELIRK